MTSFICAVGLSGPLCALWVVLGAVLSWVVSPVAAAVYCKRWEVPSRSVPAVFLGMRAASDPFWRVLLLLSCRYVLVL